jgi:penicillin-binding protein-related factor A (putative recombinase)
MSDKMDTGSRLEAKFQSWLKDIECYSHKFTDFKTLSYLISAAPQLADKIPKAPCDRLVIYQGKSFFFELKHTEGKSLPFGNVKDHQVGSLLNHEKKGKGRSYFIVEIEDNIYAVWIIAIAHYMIEADRKSFPLSFFHNNGRILEDKFDLLKLLQEIR